MEHGMVCAILITGILRSAACAMDNAIMDCRGGGRLRLMSRMAHIKTG